MMYCVRFFLDATSGSRDVSGQAAFHYAKTLQHLQARIDAYEKSGQAATLSDATIFTVITLALAAEQLGDLVTAQHHIDGLLKMVSLRGGVRALDVHKNLQVKVCRYDSSFYVNSFFLLLKNILSTSSDAA